MQNGKGGLRLSSAGSGASPYASSVRHGLQPSSALLPATPSSGSFGSYPRKSPAKALPGSQGRNLFSPDPSQPSHYLQDDELVQVAVRVRPQNGHELKAREKITVSMNPATQEVLVANGAEDSVSSWKVDMPIWSAGGSALDGSPSISQAELYQRIGRPLLQHSLEGYNSTLIAFGQTGSGKTHTMMGRSLDNECDDALSDSEEGIVPRVCKELFRELGLRTFTAASGEALSWEVHVRYVEVYCEKVSDLLSNCSPVLVREETTRNGSETKSLFALTGSRRVRVHSMMDIMQVLRLGNRCRKTAATALNERSSRSHAIFFIELTEVLSIAEEDGLIATAPSKSVTIRFVDLAGSERASESGFASSNMKETSFINLSLFTLGQVIECLSDPRRRSIKPPYRDSVLTKILRDSFGGNTKTTMICTIAPSESFKGQTIQTLNYAAKARRVVNKPRVEENPSAAELRRANEELISLRRDLDEARRQGMQVSDIEQQLLKANARLRREQEEACCRREALERSEQQLIQKLQQMEVQRQSYEERMLVLEQEADRLRREREQSEKLLEERVSKEGKAKARIKELEKRRHTAESLCRKREAEYAKRERQVEEQIKELEKMSERRIEELLREKEFVVSELEEFKCLSRELEVAGGEEQRRQRELLQGLGAQHAMAELEWQARHSLTLAVSEFREMEFHALHADAMRLLRSSEQQVEAAQGAVQQSVAQCEATRAAQAKVEREHSSLLHRFNALQEEHSKVREAGSIEEAQAQNTALAAEAAALRDELAVERATRVAENNARVQQIAELISRIEQSKQLEVAATDREADLRSRVKELEAALRAENGATATQVITLRREVEQANRRLRLAGEQLEALRERENGLLGEAEHLQQRIAELEVGRDRDLLSAQDAERNMQLYLEDVATEDARRVARWRVMEQKTTECMKNAEEHEALAARHALQCWLSLIEAECCSERQLLEAEEKDARMKMVFTVTTLAQLAGFVHHWGSGLATQPSAPDDTGMGECDAGILSTLLQCAREVHAAESSVKQKQQLLAEHEARIEEYLRKIAHDDAQRCEAQRQTALVEREAHLAALEREAVETGRVLRSTLAEQESSLAILENQNREMEARIRDCDASLSGSRKRHAYLLKLLEERQRLLHREHTRRVNGKESALSLADSLLTANAALTKQGEVWKRKFYVLRLKEQVECEQCAWLNTREANVCRCCGNTELA